MLNFSLDKRGHIYSSKKVPKTCWNLVNISLKVFQSASLCLTTTTPEQLASALQWLMLPLRYIGVSGSEIVLILLSLRFISLVFDEFSLTTSIASSKIFSAKQSKFLRL